jgi:GTP-binding protein Era
LTIRRGFIALAGRPNAGKSTFLNHVLGEKVSIVSDKPQTTRNRVLGVYHGEGLQIGFLDLPGIHKPKHQMNRLMMRQVNQSLSDADLVFHFIDVSVNSGSGDKFVKDLIARFSVPVILVPNKLDLVNQAKVIPVLEGLYEEFKPDEMVPVSALKGRNVDRLMEVATRFLPEGEPLFPDDELTDQPLRFMVQEWIREKVLHYTRDEIPHVTAVTVEEWRETEDGLELDAVITVEKSSQRRIILGAGGQMISKIRTGAQRSLRQQLQKPVHLDIFVKVQADWRNRPGDLFTTQRLTD